MEMSGIEKHWREIDEAASAEKRERLRAEHDNLRKRVDEICEKIRPELLELQALGYFVGPQLLAQQHFNANAMANAFGSSSGLGLSAIAVPNYSGIAMGTGVGSWLSSILPGRPV